MRADSRYHRAVFKGPTKDDYVLPGAHYEMSVLAWKQGCDRSTWPKDPAEVDAYRLKKVNESQSYLDIVKTWESFVLDARLGMRVQTGMDSLTWLKKKKHWA